MLRSVSALLKTALGRMYVYITMSASATRWIMPPLLLNMQLQPNFGKGSGVLSHHIWVFGARLAADHTKGIQQHFAVQSRN